MPKVRLSHDTIISLYQSGKSADQVAHEVGCSKPGVFAILRKHGIATRTGAKRKDVEVRLGFRPTKKWLRTQLREYETAAAAARAAGIPYPTFIDLLERNGIERPVWRGGPGPAGSPVRQDIPIKEAVRLSEAGVTYSELAVKYGVSYGVIVRRMKGAGHRAPRNKQTKNPLFPHIQGPKRRVLNELSITACQICQEERALDYCHIVPDNKGGPIVADNCLVLCPTHHRLFDTDSLTPAEQRKIAVKVKFALQKYGVY